MFQFPGFAFLTLCIQVKNTWLCILLPALRQTTVNNQVGFPIRKFTDQSLFSAPRNLSQSTTSFIASYCQGIHQTPFSRLIRSRRRKIVFQSIEITLNYLGIEQMVLMSSIRTRSPSRSVYILGKTHTDFLGNTLDVDEDATLCASCKFSLRCHRDLRLSRSLKRSKRIMVLTRCKRQSGMVEPIGIEPMTPCLQSRCSPS